MRSESDSRLPRDTASTAVPAVEARGISKAYRLYAKQAAMFKAFADYEKKTTRVIPVVRLQRIS